MLSRVGLRVPTSSADFAQTVCARGENMFWNEKCRSTCAPASTTHIESLEPRQLFATVAPGFQTDQAYGGAISNGTAMEFSPDGRLWVTTQTGQLYVIPKNGSGSATLAATLTVDS